MRVNVNFLGILLWVLTATTALAGPNKVDVCHIPPGNPDNFHTISVSANALDAHLGHGDLEGSCLENCEALCSDGDACTQDVESDLEACICATEPEPVDCDDSNPCTVDSCNSGVGACIYDSAILNGTSCDDGDPDTDNDVCSDGICEGEMGGSCLAEGAVCDPFAQPNPCCEPNFCLIGPNRCLR